MSIYKPKWFEESRVMISTAPTCGLTKGGRLLRKVDPDTAGPIQILDPETGAPVDAINDQLLEDMEALAGSEDPLADYENGAFPETLAFVPAQEINLRCAVPAYYDRRFEAHFEEAMLTDQFAGFSSASLGELVSEGLLEIRGGHGSPSQEQRIGDVPYIKVSDLRAGLININPTNRVPRRVAESFWRGPASGLRAYDLVCPERTSKNIGDFCILMPGQEQVLVTKEVIVLRPGPDAEFDPFYLLWAMTLRIVRDQWKRVVFMQTNREDVGKRYLEIKIPVPPSRSVAEEVSKPFRTYYRTLAEARQGLMAYLAQNGDHHFFVSGAEKPSLDDELHVPVDNEFAPDDPSL